MKGLSENCLTDFDVAELFVPEIFVKQVEEVGEVEGDRVHAFEFRLLPKKSLKG